MELVGKYKIEDRDLNTGFSSISPFYEYQQNTNKQVLAGYNAQTLVNITIQGFKAGWSIPVLGHWWV